MNGWYSFNKFNMIPIKEYGEDMFFAILLFINHSSAQEDVMFEDFTVEGTVQRPSLDAVMTRKNLSSGFELRLHQSFLIEIRKSLKSGPF